ncbi:MAG: hypothetical protein ACRDWW_07520, partial [Acidimicrobiales bacterium]
MSRLIRFLAITAAGGLLIAGATTGLAFVGDGILHHTATADAMPLPALGTSTLEGSTVYAADGTTVLAVLLASKEIKPVLLSRVSKILFAAVLDT